jgi:hypothetical protein
MFGYLNGPLNGRRREPIAHFLAYWNAQVVLAVVLGLMTSAAVAQDWGPELGHNPKNAV